MHIYNLGLFLYGCACTHVTVYQDIHGKYHKHGTTVTVMKFPPPPPHHQHHSTLSPTASTTHILTHPRQTVSLPESSCLGRSPVSSSKSGSSETSIARAAIICFSSQRSGDEILLKVRTSPLSSSSGAFTSGRVEGRSGFLALTSSPLTSPPTMLRVCWGFRSSPFFWSTSWQTEKVKVWSAWIYYSSHQLRNFVAVIGIKVTADTGFSFSPFMFNPFNTKYCLTCIVHWPSWRGWFSAQWRKGPWPRPSDLWSQHHPHL